MWGLPLFEFWRLLLLQTGLIRFALVNGFKWLVEGDSLNKISDCFGDVLEESNDYWLAATLLLVLYLDFNLLFGSLIDDSHSLVSNVGDSQFFNNLKFCPLTYIWLVSLNDLKHC